VVVILFATLPGTGWSAEPWLVRMRLFRALHPHPSAADVVDGVRNIVLFAGLGVVWIATTRTRRLWPPVWRATAAGALVSLLVETAQLTSPTRYASVLDVGTNGLGAFVGALAAAAVIRFTRWELEHGRSETPFLLLAASYAGASALEAFSPWGRLNRVPGAWGGPGKRLAAALEWMRTAPAAAPSLVNMLLFAPTGALAAGAMLAYGWRPARAAVGATLLSAAIFVTGELARGVAGGDVQPHAALWNVAAAALGAAAVAAAHRRRGAGADWERPGGRTPAWLGAAALLVLVLWYWRPFALKAELLPSIARDNLVPLRMMRGLFTIYSVADVGIDFLLFFALGVWLHIRPLRRRGPLGGVLPALALVVLLEAGQLWVRDRTADVTDVLIQWAGVLVGAAVVSQARLRERRRTLRARRGAAA
jgi:VanZ family protein